MQDDHNSAQLPVGAIDVLPADSDKQPTLEDAVSADNKQKDMRSLLLVIDLVLLLAMFCVGAIAPTCTVLTGIAIQGSFLLTVYGDFTWYFVRHIYGFLIGALVFVLFAGITLLIPLVLPCLMLSACVKTALHIISRFITMKHASQQWQPAQPRPIRRKETLRQRRCFKKVFREQAKQYRRMRSDYGERAAWLYYHPAARHLVNVLIDTAVSLMIGLLWTCVAVVLTTFLRILLALVIYAMALVVVGTVFWFIAVLLWWLCISGTSTTAVDPAGEKSCGRCHKYFVISRTGL